MFFNERLAPGLYRRMHDSLERLELRRVSEHDVSQTFAVEGSAADRSRKELADLFDECAAGTLETADNRVGVKARYPGLLEHLRDRRLAHSNRAGERNLDHEASNPRALRAPSSGISGMPRIVKWSPSMRSNSWTPRASKRNTPTV